MMTILWVLGIGMILLWDVFWWLTGIKPIMPGTLKGILSEDHKKVLLLDVRTPFEYHWFRIPNTTSQPTLLVNPKALPPTDPKRPIVVVCLSGHRSAVAAYRLRKLGFQNVSYLIGGMLAWLLSGGPTVRSSKNQQVGSEHLKDRRR